MREEVEVLKNEKEKHYKAIEWHLTQIRHLEKQEQIQLEAEVKASVPVEPSPKCSCE